MVTQTLILGLLKELKDDFGMSYFFITHDLKAAYQLSDTLGVLDHGQLAGLYDKHRFLKSDHPVVQEMKRSILAEHPRFRSIRTRAVRQ